MLWFELQALGVVGLGWQRTGSRSCAPQEWLVDDSPLLPPVTRSSVQLSAHDGKKQAPAAQPRWGSGSQAWIESGRQLLSETDLPCCMKTRRKDAGPSSLELGLLRRCNQNLMLWGLQFKTTNLLPKKHVFIITRAWKRKDQWCTVHGWGPDTVAMSLKYCDINSSSGNYRHSGALSCVSLGVKHFHIIPASTLWAWC